MAVPSQEIATTILVVGIIALLYARRIVLSIRGSPVSTVRLALYSLFVSALFAFAVASGFSLVPWYVYPILAAAIIAAFALAEPAVRRRVVLEEREPGLWVYRLSPIVPLVYLSLFVARLLVDLFVLNFDPFVYAGGTISAPSGTGWIVATIDVLFGASTGLVLGRNVAVYRVFARKRAETPAPGRAMPPA